MMRPSPLALSAGAVRLPRGQVLQAVDSQLVLTGLGVLLAVTAHLSGLWKAPAGATEVEPRHDACLLELLKVLPLDVLAAEWQANERPLPLRGARQPDAPTIQLMCQLRSCSRERCCAWRRAGTAPRAALRDCAALVSSIGRRRSAPLPRDHPWPT